MPTVKPITKAIFPVAGFGTRFLPATKAQPKEMLPVVDKPVIQYLVEEAVAAGIRDIIIVTGRGKRAIEDHFDSSFELEHTLVEKEKHALLDEVRNISRLANFVYVRQPQPLGDGHAILCARNLIGPDEACAVLFGDDIIDSPVPAIRQLMDVYEQTGCSVIGVKEVPRENISSYGVIGGENLQLPAAPELHGVYQVNQLIEKPQPEKAPSNLAIIGKYIVTPAVFECIATGGRSAGGEQRLIDGFEQLMKKEKIYARILEGTRYDTGQKIGLITATIDFALKRPDIGPELRNYLKNLKI
jgi:UTP--glucose-1-phosphate uridylyltransferase